MKSLAWHREESKKSSLKNPSIKKTLATFYETTGSKIRCDDITGMNFNTLDDHTNFIRNGGCDSLLKVLAKS